MRPRALSVLLVLAIARPASAAPTCPITSPASVWSGTSLDGNTTRSGVAYDGTGQRLQLQPAAGKFTSTTLGIHDATVYAATGDFDHDGWTDFAGASDATAFLRIYENHTYESPEPNWDDPTAVRTPKFVTARELQPATATSGQRPVAVGDFDGNGWPDVFMITGTSGAKPTSAKIWLNRALNDAAGFPQFGTGYNALGGGTVVADLGTQSWGGTSLMALDYNGDRKVDLLVANGDNGGTINVFLNTCTLATGVANPPAPPAPLPCADTPTFRLASTMITAMGYPASTPLPMFDYQDVDGDGVRDLIAGAPSCCTAAATRLRLWKGLAGGGLTTSPQSIAFQGAATVVFVADFSLDGKPDLIVGTDNWNYNANHGGESFYWTNNGTATPFSSAPAKLTSYNYPTLYDFDVGFTFDYDHDPAHTLDLMIADGNNSSNFYIQANRVLSQYVTCGDVASGAVQPQVASGGEAVVTAARIHPTMSLDTGTVTFYLSNEDPANWVQAADCGDHTGDVCASFPKPVGREVRWKATLCSNAAHTRTPTITRVDLKFDYTPARDYFRAGVIVSDGVAYQGGFRQPGDRGHLYALDAALTQTYWDVATAIDAATDSSRHLYTSDPTGTARLDFTTSAAASAPLIATLGAASASQAAAVVAWARGRRFGVGNVGIESSRLGAIETSTPALVGPPGTPVWYSHAAAADRVRFQQYRDANKTRPQLIVFGSKDGMIHAVRTTPLTIKTAPSGTEAWAFVPPRTASGMVADYTASLAAGTTQVASYPDGSPTISDYLRADGSYGTVAVVSSGNGGKSLMVLDVSNTVSADGTINGPSPLWTATPGEADAGQGLSKPAVARVQIAGRERFVVVAATGVAHDNPTAPFTKGRIVSAYDVATGALLWKFQAQCAVTSDVTVFETDDSQEPGGPRLDGFMDRVVFADACGYVYKVAPGVDLGGGWNPNLGLGAIAVDPTSTGVAQYALFSTLTTRNALGARSPIAGTLAARTDTSSRLVLFFGTGGVESQPVTARNEFYAVYADTGEIRSKLSGACGASGCEKFYGGAVATTEQIVFTRTIDPPVAVGRCDFGSTVIEAAGIDGDANGGFQAGFSTSAGAAVMGALYGDAGAIYFAMLSGGVSRIGTPRAAVAGGDSRAAATAGPNAGPLTTSEALVLMGWTQVY